MENKNIIQFLKTDIRNYAPAAFNLDLIQKHDLELDTLLNYTYHPDKQVAFRAAWLLEHTIAKEPDLLSSIYNKFVERLPEQKNWSCQRSFTKILMLSTHKKSTMDNNVTQEERIIETIFHWLITDKCPVAVVVNCLDVLYNLSDKYPWIKDELTAQIYYLLKNPTPALAARAKRILKRIT